MRVIQDSEDEDDLEIEEVAVTGALEGASPNHTSNTIPPQPGEKGTGSTASLQRAIAAAHRDQFADALSDRRDPSSGDPSRRPSAANPSAFSQDAPGSSISLPGRASKRRKTSSDGSFALPITRDIFPITYGKRHNSHADENTYTRLGPAPNNSWDLQGSMREDWEHHEPVCLFPQSVSSTIPNATATQQRQLADVFAPELIGVEPQPDVPKYEPAKSSVPWSDYLKLSGRGDSSQSPMQPRNCSSTPSSGSVLPKAMMHDRLIALEQTLLPSPDVQQNAPEKSWDGENQLQSPAEDTNASPPSKDPQEFRSLSNAEDDLLNMGLPQEQYKPRPSRSRSMRLDIEKSIDYSKRPEKAGKKTRRSRTSDGLETASTATTPEKLRQICDMGFSPSTAKKALRQHHGDVTHTVHWLVTNDVTNRDELAPPMSPVRKKKSKAKRDESRRDPSTAPDPVTDTSILLAETNGPAITDHASGSSSSVMPPKGLTIVQVVIPKSKKTNTPVQDRENQTTVATLPEPISETSLATTTNHQAVPDGRESQLGEQTIVESQATAGEKRGRGRPRKSQTKPVEPAVEEPPQEHVRKPVELWCMEEKLLENKISQSDKHSPHEGNLESHQANNAENGTAHPIVADTSTDPRPEKRARPANEASSTSIKSKTPYRVGLSKRARIAPLLRTLKK